MLDLKTIFNDYRHKVYRLALSISKNEKDAEDILQNTFFKVVKNLEYFRGESSISTWIYKIAYHEALLYLKKKKSQAKLTDSLKQEEEKTSGGLFINWSKLPDKELLDEELKDRLDKSIKNLPIKYRMPLLLDNVEELSLKEISSILGLKINSLKTRLHRARLNLKEEISDYFKDKEAKQLKKCDLLTDFVYNYASGNLKEKEADSFKKHIDNCLSCKEFLNTYSQAIRLTHALECQDLSPNLQDKVESFLFKK